MACRQFLFRYRVFQLAKWFAHMAEVCVLVFRSLDVRASGRGKVIFPNLIRFDSALLRCTIRSRPFGMGQQSCLAHKMVCQLGQGLSFFFRRSPLLSSDDGTSGTLSRLDAWAFMLLHRFP